MPSAIAIRMYCVNLFVIPNSRRTLSRLRQSVILPGMRNRLCRERNDLVSSGSRNAAYDGHERPRTTTNYKKLCSMTARYAAAAPEIDKQQTSTSGLQDQSR